MFYFFITGKPLQAGYFFSSKMKEKINAIQKNYDCIIFHLIRSTEFLPDNYKGTKILEMTDLVSSRYFQLYKNLSFLNPFKYLYFLEYILSKKYEKKIINFFNHIVLVSKEDKSKFSLKIEKKTKIKVITNGTDLKRKIYKFKRSNRDVIFIGNINYLPNKIACFNFIKETMPKLKRRGINIKLKIIGQTSKILKFLLTRFNNVEVHNNIPSPEKLCKNAICGISNLSIAAGIQNKILEYMRIGLPTIISQKCFNSLDFKNNKDLIVYKNQEEFVRQIFKLKTKKNFANKISHNCHAKIVKNHSWKKSLKKYTSLLKK